jgi:hypothetical protein
MLGRFAGRQQTHRQRVDAALQQGSEALVHHPVTLHPGLAAEGCADEVEPEVRAGTRARMSGMGRTLVLKFEFQRLQVLQAGANSIR